MARISRQHAGKMMQKRETVHDTVEWGKQEGWRSVHRGQASEGHPDALPRNKGDSGVFAGTGRCFLLITSVFLSRVEAWSFIS